VFEDVCLRRFPEPWDAPTVMRCFDHYSFTVFQGEGWRNACSGAAKRAVAEFGSLMSELVLWFCSSAFITHQMIFSSEEPQVRKVFNGLVGSQYENFIRFLMCFVQLRAECTDYRYKCWTGSLSHFASTNS
jgi:hypothetical protein